MYSTQICNITVKKSFGKVIRDSFTMAQRRLLKIKHSPDQLIDVTVFPAFFMLLFTFLFGGAVSGDTASYMPIIVPGMLIFTLLSCSSSTGTQLREDIGTGVFDRFKSLPVTRIAPLAGSLLADIPRYLLAASVAAVVGGIIGWRPDGGFVSVVAAIAFASVFSWAISWIFAFIGLISSGVSAVSEISTLVMFALTFLSNAFVPSDTLPGWLQTFVGINPITHIISAIREITQTGALVNGELGIAIAIAALVVIIFAPLTLFAYNKKIN